MDAEVWNDDVMVGLLHDAIRTHRTRRDESCGKRSRVEWTSPTELLLHGENSHQTPPSAELNVSANVSGNHIEQVEVEVPQTAATSSSESYLHSQTRRTLAADPGMDEPLTTLLMAWYNCGYATGRYQTLMELQGIPEAASIHLQSDAADASTAASESYPG